MEEVDKGCLMIRMGVSGWMFLPVLVYPGSLIPKAVKCLCVMRQWTTINADIVTHRVDNQLCASTGALLVTCNLRVVVPVNLLDLSISISCCCCWHVESSDLWRPAHGVTWTTLNDVHTHRYSVYGSEQRIWCSAAKHRNTVCWTFVHIDTGRQRVRQESTV